MLGFGAISEASLSELPSSSGPQSTTASGFMPVHFGAPESLTATGFKATSFGTPTSPTHQTETASGFMPVHVGIAVAPAVATGFKASNLGTPQLVPTAVGFRASHLGIPSIPLNASGFMPVHFGASLTWSQFNTASAFRVGLFGTPTTSTAQVCTASGFLPVHYWSPAAIRMRGTTLNRRGLMYYPMRPVRLGTPHV